jgi:hypothetical protein
MIPGAKINLGEHLGCRQLMKEDIDAWEGYLFFIVTALEIVHTQTETFIFL